MDKPKYLTKYIRDDGTVEGTTAETYFAPIMRVEFDLEDNFIRMFSDNGPTDIETRLSFEDLRKLLDEAGKLTD